MNKNKMMFFAPDEGGGEGGAGGTGATPPAPAPVASKGLDAFGPAKTTTGERPLPEQKIDQQIKHQDPQQGDGGAPGSGSEGAGTRTPKPFDPAEFAKTFSKTVSDALKPVVQEKKQELTPEEAKKLLNIWEPDEAWHKEYDNLDTRASAIKKQRDGLILQADTLAQLRMHEAVEAFKAEIAPQLKSVAEFAQTQREERFAKAYPMLSQPELKPLVMAVASDLKSKGQKFNSETELFKALGEGVEAVIKVTNPEFKMQSTNNQGPSGNSIPTTSPGSGAGAGRNSAPKGTKPRGLAVFE